MRKILLLVLTVFPFVSVNAISTYYSDYRPYIIGTEDVLELDDTLMKEDYRVYNTQEYVTEDLGYDVETNCPFKDENDYKTTVTIKPTNGDTSKKWYQSIYIPDGVVNTIAFKASSEVTISEIMVFNGNTQVDVTVTEENGTTIPWFDNDLSTSSRIPVNRDYSITFDDIQSNNIVIKFITDGKMNGIIGFYKDGTRLITRKINTDEIDVKDQDYLDSLVPIVGTMTGTDYPRSYIKELTYYYHCYNKVKTNTGIYKKEDEIDSDLINYDDYKELHDYYIRDKVKISDKQITSSNYNLKDLVTYSTIDNFTIEENIDYSKNGVYPVKFIFDDSFIVEKEVKINIAKNNNTSTSTTTSTVVSTTSTTKKTTSTKITTSKVSTSKQTTTSTTKVVTTVPKTESTTTTSKVVETTKPIVTTTTNKVEANNTSPTYDPYNDEVLEVEPLMGTIEKNDTCNCNNDQYKKDIILYKVIIIILLIGLASMILFDRIFKKDTL